jgi:hypothetical protein
MREVLEVGRKFLEIFSGGSAYLSPCRKERDFNSLAGFTGHSADLKDGPPFHEFQRRAGCLDFLASQRAWVGHSVATHADHDAGGYFAKSQEFARPHGVHREGPQARAGVRRCQPSGCRGES